MSPAPARFLALGDSYTIGEGVKSGERWPSQLVQRLGAEGIAVETPRFVARTGWTTDELAEGIARADLDPPYDLVSLLIGVNDQYQGRELKDYREGFRDLLAQAVSFTGEAPTRVLVLSIPDWSATPFAKDRDRSAIGHEIERFNAANREEANVAGAAYCNITPLTRTQGDLVVEDGLHPDGRAYSAWVDLMLPPARETLLARTS